MNEPPFILSMFFFGLALVIIHFGFGFYYARRRYTGVAIILFGLALGLSDGFATIGEGPLGWITWVQGFVRGADDYTTSSGRTALGGSARPGQRTTDIGRRLGQ